MEPLTTLPRVAPGSVDAASAARSSSPVVAPLSPRKVVELYHARSKHRFEAYAPGPGVLDWERQPSPFRHYEGAPRVALPLLGASGPGAVLGRLRAGQRGPVQPPGRAALAALLQLSLGVTAWKTQGPDRWAVRANPSSGNLHPVEAWVIVRGIEGLADGEALADGVYHYCPEAHALELRAADVAPDAVRSAAAGSGLPTQPPQPPQLLIALSSAMWREAWKYGERGFRYCQLDVGHAVGGLAHAAELLGWRLVELAGVGQATLAHVLGLDRDADYPRSRFPEVEREEAEIVLAVDFAMDATGEATAGASATEVVMPDAATLRAEADARQWFGRASALDAYPMYRWPLIGEVAGATRRPDGFAPSQSGRLAPARAAGLALSATGSGGFAACRDDAPAAVPLLLGRRSAQRFSADYLMDLRVFTGLLAVLDAPVPAALDASRMAQIGPLVPVLWVHRVEGLTPGVYVLARDAECPLSNTGRAVSAVGDRFDLRLRQASEAGPLQRLARELHCHQQIAAHACVTIGLVARFASVIRRDPPAYRDLFRAAGLTGQALYLVAEASGLRGTGVGCFFDDPVHALLGLEGGDYQTLYHFTVGMPVPDPRIETLPAYADHADGDGLSTDPRPTRRRGEE